MNGPHNPDQQTTGVRDNASGDASEIGRVRAAHEHTQEILRSGATRFDAVIEKTYSQGAGILLPAPAQAIVQALKAWHIDLHALLSAATSLPADASIEDCAVALGIQLQDIVLPDEWWRADHGHIVGFLSNATTEETPGPARAVALIYRRGHYVMFDPRTQKSRRVTASLAERIANRGHAVYPPLPDCFTGLTALAGYLARMIRSELRAVILAGLVIGAIAALIPMATALVIDTVIQGNERALLLQIGVALAVGAVLTFAFSLVRQHAAIRIDGQTAHVLEGAVWGRLLKLPADFFSRYSIGDLRQRICGFNAIREALINGALSAIVALILSAVYLGLLLYYNFWLALIAAGLILLLCAVTLMVGLAQLKYYRRQIEIAGWLSGFVFQMLQGIVKLRVAGAEDRAFVRWADRYADEREAILRIRRLGNHFNAFADVYTTLAMAAIFAAVHFLSAERLSTGVFVAFIAAYGSLQAAWQGLASAMLEIVAVLPDWERAKPLLDAEPEAAKLAADPGELSGEIEVAAVTFAYADGPEVLHDVSLKVAPGEHVAIVGPSGSGKSTLVRLLLGLERPASGTVLYDGQDLASIDPTRVRRQIGVVTQNGRLSAGTIMDNIRGAANLSYEQCLAACKGAGMEADLAQMPMGLHTPLTEGAATLSGGQRQRILIARALVNRPRILMFDEATSALDNLTQVIVTESLNQLAVTRIIIAHRLSTIRNASRIHVMNQGRIVESGTIDTLMAQNGLFAALAHRQLT